MEGISDPARHPNAYRFVVVVLAILTLLFSAKLGYLGEKAKNVVTPAPAVTPPSDAAKQSFGLRQRYTELLPPISTNANPAPDVVGPTPSAEKEYLKTAAGQTKIGGVATAVKSPGTFRAAFSSS